MLDGREQPGLYDKKLNMLLYKTIRNMTEWNPPVLNHVTHDALQYKAALAWIILNVTYRGIYCRTSWLIHP